MWTNEQEPDITPTPDEIETVVVLLESRHGVHAPEVADFFASYHSLNGHVERCWAWNAVAGRIRERETKRLSASGY